MNKYIVTFYNILLVFFTLSAVNEIEAQNRTGKDKGFNFLYISGRVYDLYTLEDIKGATIDLLVEPDSTLVYSHRAQSSRDGEHYDSEGYSVSIDDRSNKYIVRISKEGYNPEYINIDPTGFGKKEQFIKGDPVYLERKAKVLEGVTVTASKIKFYHRGDTLVYNADAFVLPEGSMLDALLEQLPGVQMDGNGEIKVDGKRVDYLLLDGKEFFSRDKRLMLKNIASYTIKNIEVYETLSERYTSGHRGDEALIMDVKLKKEYRTGFMGNIEAGYGTSNRYMGRVFAGMFTQTLRLGLIGNANNLNDERRPGEQGTWSPDKLGSGENKKLFGGLTYYYTAPENKYSINGEVVIDHADKKDFSYSNVTNFLPDGNNYGYHYNRNSFNNLRLNTLHAYLREYKWGYVNAGLSYNFGKGKSHNHGSEATLLRDVQDISEEKVENLYSPENNSGYELNDIVNRRMSANQNRNYNSGGSATAEVKYKFGKSGSDLRTRLEADYSAQHSDKEEEYILNFGSDPAPAQSVKRNFNNYPDHSYGLKFVAAYYLPITNRFTFRAEYDYGYSSITGTSDIYILEATGTDISEWNPSLRDNFPILDSENSFNRRQINNSHKIIPELGYDFDNNNFNQLEVKIPIEILQRRLTNFQAGVEGIVSKTTVLPWFTVAYNNMNWDTGIRFNVRYEMSSRAPEMLNYLDIANSTDPLNIYLGNPDLRNRYRHIFTANYSGKIGRSKTKHNFEIYYETIKDELARGFYYDRQTGVRTFLPMNISGDNTWYFRYEVNKDLGAARRFSIRNTFDYKRQTNHDYSSEDGETMVRSRVRDLRFTDRLNLNYNFSGNRITLFGSGTVDRFTGSLASFNAFNAWTFNYGVTGTFKLPYNFGLTTDFTVYMRRGFNDDALNTNNYVWNARLSWSTLKGNLLFMVDGWDMLHNIKNITYSVNTQGRTETYTSVLPRYVMFHIQYRFNKQPKKK